MYFLAMLWEFINTSNEYIYRVLYPMHRSKNLKYFVNDKASPNPMEYVVSFSTIIWKVIFR